MEESQPAAMASSRISLKRCESSLGSEHSIEQKSLQKRGQEGLKNIRTLFTIKLACLRKYGRRSMLILIPIHIALVLLEQINQIFLL